MSAPSYEIANVKTMKMEESCGKVHEQLFSTSTREGVAEQLMRGEGQFRHLFDRVPIETHGLNNASSTTAYKYQIKPFLLGFETRIWCLEDFVTVNTSCDSTISSSNKITPRMFMHDHYKLTERNCKPFCAVFFRHVKRKTRVHPI